MTTVDRDAVESLLRQIGDRFQELFGHPDRFLITNDSMRHLLDQYWKDLLLAWKDQTEQDLMETWREDLTDFKASWLKIGHEGLANYNNTLLPVVTESATFGARTQCAKKKSRGKRKR